MYIKKNKGLSFIETIISISIILFLSSIFLSLGKPVYKTFNIIYNKNNIERKTIALKSLISNHLFWAKQREIRVFSINSKTNLPTFSKIFSNSSESSGNILAIKYYFYDKKEKNTLQIKYRCFAFLDNKATLSYFDAYDLATFSGILNSSIILENCEGKFYYENNILKLELNIKEKNKGVKNLEYIFYF